MKNIQKKIRGFTLIELIVVIVIIAILTTMATVAFVSVRRQARDSTRMVHIGQMQSALAAYHRDYGSYPADITPGNSFVAGNITYMKQVPNNPLPVESPCSSIPEYVYPKSDGLSYQIRFCLSSQVNDIYGIATATAGGIK